MHADFDASTEQDYRRVAYLTQLAHSEALRVVVDGGRLGVAAGADAANADGRATALERPWGYLFWQLNDVRPAANPRPDLCRAHS